MSPRKPITPAAIPNQTARPTPPPSQALRTMLDRFRAARRVSTPLVGITTPDPAATIRTLCEAINGSALKFQWDISQGLLGLSPEAGAVVTDLLETANSPVATQEAQDALPATPVNRLAATQEPKDTLFLARNLPAHSILFFHNAHRFLDPDKPGNEAVIQAVWNLRDLYKGDQRTLVLLAPDLDLPAELRQDVRIIDEPLPSDTQLAAIVRDQYLAAQQSAPDLPDPDNISVDHAVDALRGVAAFPAEQITAENLTPNGLALEALWDAKRRLIEQSPGLSIWRGGERLDDLKGLQNIKGFLGRILNGDAPPRVIVIMDEFEKMMAGSRGGDLSGTSQKMHGALLSFMEDTGATGLIAFGVSGAGKTAIAKAFANEAGGLAILFNIAAMEGKLVGESVRNLRESLKVVQAASGGRAMFYAAVNGLAALSPELLQRFSFGTFFFDLPTQEEKTSIWNVYETKYALPAQTRPQDDGWVGRNIKQCCELAKRLRCTLIEAAAYIVPAGRAAAQEIQRMREQANGNFISAGYPGVYRIDRATSAASTTTPARMFIAPTN